MEESTARLAQPERETEPETENDTINLLEFPDDIIGKILCFTTPRYVCKFSTISKRFASVANFDDVWSNFLLQQQSLDQILSRAVSPIQFASKRELYFRLADSIFIDRGKKIFWVERDTGKVGCMLGARDLRIVKGRYDRYRRWNSEDESRFRESLFVRHVRQLEVRGRFDCRLLSPNTEYKVVFVLQFRPNQYGWHEVPVRFAVRTPYGQVLETSSRLAMANRTPRFRHEDGDHYEFFHGWLHRVVGKFKVRGDGEYANLPTDVEFAVEEIHGGQWKGGLLIDGVRIEPTGRI